MTGCIQYFPLQLAIIINALFMSSTCLQHECNLQSIKDITSQLILQPCHCVDPCFVATSECLQLPHLQRKNSFLLPVLQVQWYGSSVSLLLARMLLAASRGDGWSHGTNVGPHCTPMTAGAKPLSVSSKSLLRMNQCFTVPSCLAWLQLSGVSSLLA